MRIELGGGRNEASRSLIEGEREFKSTGHMRRMVSDERSKGYEQKSRTLKIS